MRNTIIISLLSLMIISCGKSKFSATPKLEFKSVNSTELHNGESIQLKLSFTDAEGDLQDSIYVERYAVSCGISVFKTFYKLPVFPSVKNSEGDIIVSFTYGSGGPYPPMQGPACGGDETCYFRFMLQDEAKHKSDTVNSDLITIFQ